MELEGVSGSVSVRYFAAARDLAGCSDERFELGLEAQTAGGVLGLVLARHPRLVPHAKRLRLALNGEFTESSAPVRAGDELVLLPPVAGGAPLPSEGAAPTPQQAQERVRRAEILEVPLSLDVCVRDVSHPGAGGLVVFLGVVRDHADGAPVVRLDYEAYTELATTELRRVLERVAEAHDGVWLSAQHRVGRLAVGDAAVVVAASAPHRGEAFDACRAAIDALKETVPIWKKEWAPDGAASWVNWEST